MELKGIVFDQIGANPIAQTINYEVQTGEKLVTLSHSALNHRDVWILKGKYAGLKFGSIMGADGLGDLEGKRVLINPGLAWGENEAAQGPNFRVLGMPDHGTFSDKICIAPQYIYDCPSHLSDAEGAALPLAGVTAYRALIVKCKPKAKEKILINGTGGGVAMMALLFAVASNCEVYVTSSSDDKIAKAVQLGAKEGFNYKNGDWLADIKSRKMSFDIIIDSAGGSGFKDLVKLLNSGGRICFYGAGHGTITELNPQIIFWKQLSILGSTMGSAQDFKNMLDFVTQHKIKPIIHDVLPISQFEKGLAMMEQGQQFGKIVFMNNF